jgi:hypothetical protein
MPRHFTHTTIANNSWTVRRVNSRYVEPRCKDNAADAMLVGPIIPIGPARVAAGRKRVIQTTGVTYRHFRSGIEIRAPRHGNDGCGAVGIVDDRACRLDRSACRRPKHLRLVLPWCREGRRDRGQGKGDGRDNKSKSAHSSSLSRTASIAGFRLTS